MIDWIGILKSHLLQKGLFKHSTGIGMSYNRSWLSHWHCENFSQTGDGVDSKLKAPSCHTYWTFTWPNMILWRLNFLQLQLLHTSFKYFPLKKNPTPISNKFGERIKFEKSKNKHSPAITQSRLHCKSACITQEGTSTGNGWWLHSKVFIRIIHVDSPTIKLKRKTTHIIKKETQQYR